MPSPKPDLVLFASEIADMLWDAEGGDVDNEAIQGVLVARGVVRYRKPTEKELADPEWWGHEFGIGPDDDGVGEFTPEMKALRMEGARGMDKAITTPRRARSHLVEMDDDTAH